VDFVALSMREIVAGLALYKIVRIDGFVIVGFTQTAPRDVHNLEFIFEILFP
jgi:hypothetical protein